MEKTTEEKRRKKKGREEMYTHKERVYIQSSVYDTTEAHSLLPQEASMRQ